MKIYCITGVKGYIGSLLANKFQNENLKFIGLDIQADDGKTDFPYYQADILDEKKITEILKKEKVSTLVHLAVYSAPEGDEALAYKINVNGLESVLNAAKKASIKRIVLSSSSAVYGSHPDNPVPLKEDHPLRANDDYYYSAHKKQQEVVFSKFLKKNPSVSYMILRPCIILGKNINNQTGALLKQPLLVNPASAMKTPVQFIHENDAVEIFYLAAKSTKSGIMNVAPEETTNMIEMASATGKILLKAPYKLLHFLANTAKFLKLSPVGGKSLAFTMNPIVVDASQMRKQLKYNPMYNSIDVLTDYIESIKKK